MKFTKTWKRFWTLNRHHAGGFTLVELIVVIAILAILAGIAIPAYSGYINKAKESGDYTLLSAINTAFAAACIENGEAAAGQNATISGYQNGDANPITVSVYNDAFQLYLGDSMNTNFKVIQSLVFDNTNGVFVNPETAESYGIKYGNTNVTVSGSVVSALKSSSFVNAGGAGLADAVNDLTTEVVDKTDLDGMISMVGGDDKAIEMLNKYTGIPADDLVEMDESDLKNMLANAIVLEVANTSTSMDKESLSAVLNGQNMTGGTQGLAQQALAYGMYAAYVNSGNAPEGTTLDYSSMQAALKDQNSGFNAYLKEDQAATDMDAYLGALGLIGENTNNMEVTSDVVLNGFGSENNSKLSEMLDQLLGTN